MNAKECILTRRSIRTFTSQPVTAADVEKIVDMARFSPSWKNSQTVRYTMILDKEIKYNLSMNCMLDFKFDQGIVNYAPAIIILSSVKNRSGYERDGSFTTSKGTHWESFDAGIAAQTFCLAAHEMGLSTVIMGVFDEEKVAKEIQLPENQSVSAIIAIGYKEKEVAAPKRKEVSELLIVK